MTDQEQLKKCLEYDPDTGLWKWKPPFTGGARKDGWFLGSISQGYPMIGFQGKPQYAHRLAWLYMTGLWPETVDHINRNRRDNRWVNLRDVTQRQNTWNQGTRSNNSSGFRGVSWNKRLARWHAYLKVNGKRKHIGFFNCIEEAKKAYESAALAAFGEFYEES